NSSASTKYTNMTGALFNQKVAHITEVLIVTTLIACQRNRLGVFLYGSVDNFLHTSVVTKMYNFATGGLYDPSHDIDRCIVTVKQTRRRYNADLVHGLIWLGCLVARQIGFCCFLFLLNG